MALFAQSRRRRCAGRGRGERACRCRTWRADRGGWLATVEARSKLRPEENRTDQGVSVSVCAAGPGRKGVGSPLTHAS